MDPARLAPQTKSQTEPKQQSDRVSAVGRVPSRLTADDWKGHRCAVRPAPAPPRRSVTRSPPITVPTPCHCGHTQTRLTSGADWLEWVTEVSSSERVSTVDPSCVVARVHPASIDGSDRGSATWGDATTGSHRAHRSPAKPPPCGAPQGERRNRRAGAPSRSDDLSLVLRQLIRLSEACRVRDEGNCPLESSRIRWL